MISTNEHQLKTSFGVVVCGKNILKKTYWVKKGRNIFIKRNKFTNKYMHASFISNTFIINARLKLGKN